MNVTKHGIPIQIPRSKKSTSKRLHNDFQLFIRFATMTGYEDGCFVTATVPVNHPDFKRLREKGFRVIDIWEKGEIA